MPTIDKATIRKVKRRDRFARWLITLGGITIIASVIGILLLIVSVTLPLFRGARSEVLVRAALPASLPDKKVLCVGVDRVELAEEAGEDSLTAYLLTEDGTFTFLDVSGRPNVSGETGTRAPGEVGSEAPEDHVLGRRRATPPTPADGQTIRSVDRSAGQRYSLLWSDGSVSLVELALTPEFDELGRRSVNPKLRTLASLPVEQGRRPLQALVRKPAEDAVTCARLLPENTISVVREVTVESILGEAEKKTSRTVIEEGIPGRVTAMTMDWAGTRLFAGTENGCLVTWQFDDDSQLVHHEVVPAFRDRRAITSLAVLFGDVALAVGDEKGHLSVWFELRTETSKKLRLIHPLSRHSGPVLEIVPSRRDKSLVSLGQDGRVFLDYATTENHLLTLAGDRPLGMIGYSPRGNAVIGLDARRRLVVWGIDNPHPEVSWGTLFGKVHYENHPRPKFMWQSSGTHEPKFSLVPVIFGTFKSTLYAMLVAVPLAVFAAIYVSHFTTPGFKRVIKPVVEIMAAVPTVVVGFLVLLWLAPLMGRWIVALLASLLTLPVTFVLFMFFWQPLRKFHWARRLENGYEFLLLAPAMALGVVIAASLAAPIEAVLFGGDFKQWLFEATGRPYDPLNSIAVAFGLGFAVIPVIFSISEDSLSGIPYDLSAASLALGASRWQTVWRVICPCASPGIFAAVMIGFGRAVGETMIVFMATGNTPILDWSPFNGFRTLSANIAVEVSEAPRDGTLYRVLFLCAVILFLLTFVLNTAAELVRHHLRKRYGRY